jgi:hypothetical protein
VEKLLVSDGFFFFKKKVRPVRDLLQEHLKSRMPLTQCEGLRNFFALLFAPRPNPVVGRDHPKGISVKNFGTYILVKAAHVIA